MDVEVRDRTGRKKEVMDHLTYLLEEEEGMDVEDILAQAIKLGEELQKATETLGPHEARFLVDRYYIDQERRKRSDNQAKALARNGEPNDFIRWIGELDKKLEGTIQKIMGIFAQRSVPGAWAQAQHGIGPVISGALVAHIDISKVHYGGQIWRFSGLDPSSVWLGRERAEKLIREVFNSQKKASWEILCEIGRRTNRKPQLIQDLVLAVTKKKKIGDVTRKEMEKVMARRPWNARLKVIAYHIGQSFKKGSSNPKCYYGKFYRERKEYEIGRNESGGNVLTAKKELKEKKYDKQKDAYKWYSGQVTPADYREYRRLTVEYSEKKKAYTHAVSAVRKCRKEITRAEKKFGENSEAHIAAKQKLKRAEEIKADTPSPGEAPKVKTVEEGKGLPMLPPQQIDMRACRWTAKLFLYHYFEVAYEDHYKEPPPKAYVFEHLGHTRRIPRPEESEES